MNAIKKNEDINDILKNGFIQIGIEYAKLFRDNRAEFKRLFKESKAMKSICQCVYWAYKSNGLIQEVVRETGESEDRFVARKILAVIKTITE